MTLDGRRGYWDRIAGDYDSLFEDPYSAFEDELVFNRLRRLGPCVGASVLEIGCGTGLGCSMVKRWGIAEYHGIDTSGSMLDIARRNHPDSLFSQLDVEHLTSLDGKFDYIIAINGVCSYIDDIDVLLRDIAEISKPGSRVLLSFINRSSLRRIVRCRTGFTEALQCRGAPACANGKLQFLYNSGELIRKAEAAGFSGVRVRAYGLFGGLWQNCFTASLERVVPVLGCAYGHSIIVVAQA